MEAMVASSISEEVRDEDSLIAWMASGARTADDWRIGSEHERFIYEVAPNPEKTPEQGAHHRHLQWQGERGIRAFLEEYARRHNWRVAREGDEPVMLTDSASEANITLEPGGQIELSGAPLHNLHQVAQETELYSQTTGALAQEFGARFLGLGAAPEWTVADMPTVPKQRYRIMRPLLEKSGHYGLELMHLSATIQVNLDFCDEQDFMEKFQVSLALQPLATALFANSPFFLGKAAGRMSMRMAFWDETDPARCLAPDFLFLEGAGLADYARWALSVPMFFMRTGNDYVMTKNSTFADFLNGTAQDTNGDPLPRRPTYGDWEDHLGALFPPVRAKRWLEMRGTDGGCRASVVALAAFWTGMLYDSESRQAGLHLSHALAQGELARLRQEVQFHGLTTPMPLSLIPACRDLTPVGEMPAKTENLADLAALILRLAEAGLARRARQDGALRDETCYLAPLWRRVAERRSPAKRRLALWRGVWEENFAPLYQDAHC